MEAAPVLRSLAAAIAGLALAAAPALADHPLKGELEGVHADYFDEGFSDTRWSLATGDETLRLLPTEIPALAPGETTVEVSGEGRGGSVVGSVTPSSLQAAPALGARKLAVIMFNFSDDGREPWTPAEVRERIFTEPDSTSAFFREESHEQLWLTGASGNLDGDVYGGYTLAAPRAPCSYENWASAANSAAAAHGFVAGQYQHVMYVFPGQTSCGWAGLAELSGTRSWINGNLAVRVTGHELGHNLGLHHAGSWECTDAGAAVTLSANCSLDEYDDPFDNMGNHGSRHSHGWHLQQLGVLAASNVQTVTESGTYSMTSALDPTSAPTTLRIPRTRSGGGAVLDWYYLEVRESGGEFDDFLLDDPVVEGVSIRVNDDPSRATVSRLLDAHPGPSSADAPLGLGETFSDGRVGVTTVSAEAGDATVAITIASAPADTHPPSTPAGLGHSFTATGVLRLGWSASSDDTGVTDYPVFRDGQQVASSGSTSYEDAAAGGGAHVYTVYADDAASNRSAPSAPYTVVIPGPPARSGDRTGPRIRLRRVAARNGRLLFLARARDVSGVARLALFLDGRRLRGTRSATLRHRWRKRPGRHRVLVRAFDARGNRGSLAVRLRIRR